MVTLHIQNFKCFEKAEVPINQLTVLAGGNGNGKSSVIQALLLLRRTLEKKEGNVELNGVYCLNLGNSANLAESDIYIDLIEGEKHLKVKYDTHIGNELFITPTILEDTYKENPLHFKEFYYLNAERIGPRISQPLLLFSLIQVSKENIQLRLLKNLIKKVQFQYLKLMKNELLMTISLFIFIKK